MWWLFCSDHAWISSDLNRQIKILVRDGLDSAFSVWILDVTIASRAHPPRLDEKYKSERRINFFRLNPNK